MTIDHQPMCFPYIQAFPKLDSCAKVSIEISSILIDPLEDKAC